MGIIYPIGVDTFSVPTLPEATSLSSAGTSRRNHTESHDDLGKAVEALETYAAQFTHDHSGNGNPFPTFKLQQQNTHQNSDTDLSSLSMHHTLGSGATQAAAGNHIHDYEGPTIINKPLVICTSATRPTDQHLGMMIYETDTNCVRVWAEFNANNIFNPYGGLNTANTFSHGCPASQVRPPPDRLLQPSRAGCHRPPLARHGSHGGRAGREPCRATPSGHGPATGRPWASLG